MSQPTSIKLGSSSFPRLGLGTWQTKPEDVEQVVYDAIKLGYRHIDCASVYGNEKFVGKALKRAFDEKIVKREQLWITSKLWNTNHASIHVKEACMRTLSDLGLTYLDLYLMHFPISLEYVSPDVNPYPTFFNDPKDPKKINISQVPISETWGAMEKLVEGKLVKHIGVSNFDLQLLQDLLKYCKIKPITIQIERHPYLQQRNMIRYCETIDVIVTAYSPLGGAAYIQLGMTKKDETQLLSHPELLKIAKTHGKTVPQILIKWSIQSAPNVVVIPKASSLKHAKENFALFDFELTASDMETIGKLDCYRRYNDVGLMTTDAKPYLVIFS